MKNCLKKISKPVELDNQNNTYEKAVNLTNENTNLR